MLDYIFFDQGLRERFADFVSQRGVEVTVSDEEGLLASIPEDLDDDLTAEIEHCYELLLQENAELLESTEDRLEKNVAGVRVVLGDGTACTIRFDPDLLARVLQSITMEELRDMVQHIATSVENPDDRPLCHT
jgi:Arc/MetJ family transcription regulator